MSTPKSKLLDAFTYNPDYHDIQTAGVFVPANASGLQPVEFKIVIEPEDIEETDEVMKAAKAAGIAIVHETKIREEMRQIKGVLIAVGGNAFQDWNEPKPKVGDKIYFAKYAGDVVIGTDGKKYRLTNDKDVSAILL